VAICSTDWIFACGPSVGFLRKSFTVAVSSCSCTAASSSANVSRNVSSSSSALSMRSAYSPMIHTMAALASGSSSVSRFSHSVAMMDS
jgi:hypothetical protein